MPVSRFHELKQLAPLVSRFNPGAEAILGRMERAQKCVYSVDVTKFIHDHDDDFTDELASAYAAGVTDLPYNPMLVEYLANGWRGPGARRNFWLIEGGGAGRYRLEFGCLNPCGHRLLPGILHDGWLDVQLNTHGRATVKKVNRGISAALERRDPGADDHMMDEAYDALFFAMALHVSGIIQRPGRIIDAKLDKARQRRGLPPIPKDYLTIHIGYVFDEEGNKVAYQEDLGKSPSVHWRRGHRRWQVCGPRHREHKLIWIRPALVNHVEGTPLPKERQILVVP